MILLVSVCYSLFSLQFSGRNVWNVPLSQKFSKKDWLETFPVLFTWSLQRFCVSETHWDECGQRRWTQSSSHLPPGDSPPLSMSFITTAPHPHRLWTGRKQNKAAVNCSVWWSCTMFQTETLECSSQVIQKLCCWLKPHKVFFWQLQTWRQEHTPPVCFLTVNMRQKCQCAISTH